MFALTNFMITLGAFMVLLIIGNASIIVSLMSLDIVKSFLELFDNITAVRITCKGLAGRAP